MTRRVLSQHTPGTLPSHTLASGVHFAKPKIQTRFIVRLMETMTKMRKYLVQRFVTMR